MKREFTRHFRARFLSLILLPFLIYLFWFWLHFAILTHSGPGDDFMSPAFQATLKDNPMTSLSKDIHYYDTITIVHKDTKAYLHSHNEQYPLRYDDGRISSQGQQVTGYPFNDTNNHWLVLPSNPDDVTTDTPVKHKDVIKLRHLVTDTDLLTHDVASPLFATNQEFTTVSLEESSGTRFNDTLFTVELEHNKEGAVWRTRAGQFKLIHVPTRVAMWTHTKVLPEWGFQQQEINGNKNLLQSSNIWFVEDIIDLKDEGPSHLKSPADCSARGGCLQRGQDDAIYDEISRVAARYVLS
jgi:dolichyl-phosphate-mannose-protein mannosyltransferase